MSELPVLRLPSREETSKDLGRKDSCISAHTEPATFVHAASMPLHTTHSPLRRTGRQIRFLKVRVHDTPRAVACTIVNSVNLRGRGE